MTFDTTPKPAFLRGLQQQKWTISGALSELVDNSFGPARGDATRCEITYDPASRRLTVLDNGRGMDSVGRLFQLGNAIGRAPGDIGLYGSGGTMALIWLADRVRIWTLRDGKVNHDTVTWNNFIGADAFPVVSDAWAVANSSNTPPSLLANRHGTLIELSVSLARTSSSRGTIFTSNIMRDLSETYAPAKRLGKKLIWSTLGKNGQQHTLGDSFEALDQDSKVVISGGLMVGDEFLEVRGEIGLVEGLSRDKSKVAIGYGSRVIFKTRDCFTSPDGAEKFLAAGVTGWIDLRDGWQPYLTVLKDDIADGPVRETLMAWLFERARPLLKKVEDSSLQLLLDGIALGLRLTMGEPRDRHLGTGQGPTPGDGHSVVEIEPTTGETVPDKQTAKTRSSGIEITKLDDAAMDGRLCYVERDRDGVVAFVNEDHPIVKEALKAQPLNRMALELLVTREIADLLEKDEELRVRSFRLQEQELIEARGAAGATIHRLLIDRVRREAA